MLNCNRVRHNDDDEMVKRKSDVIRKKGKELDNFKTRFYYFYLVRFAYMPLLLFIPILCICGWGDRKHCSRLMGFFHRSDHGKFFFLFSYNKQLTWKHPHLNFYLVSFLLRIFEISFLFCFFTLWIFDLERCMHVNEYFYEQKDFCCCFHLQVYK